MKSVFITGGSGFVGQNLIPMLLAKDYEVIALARSAVSAKKITEMGAVVANGDVLDRVSIAEGLKGCDSVIHLAASVDFFANEKDLYDLHVKATSLLLEESKKIGIKKFVYLSAASVIMNGRPINGANEDFVSDNLLDGYSRTKLQAEKLVLKANSDNFKTIALRPPLIWGKGDPNVLPKIIEAVHKKQMQFIGDGLHRFVTCHVLSVCHALVLAEQSEQNGKTYFINDERPSVFKHFIKRYTATQGVIVPEKSVSVNTAKIIAGMMEFVWKTFKLKGYPPLFKAMVNTLGLEFITDDSRARKEIGYVNLVSIDEGFERM